jgi:RimJ/RimL family protein N-acetyltransferase
MLKGERVNLRLITEKDVSLLREWRNKNASKFFTKDEITPQQQKAWYQRYSDRSGTDYMFIVEKKDKTPMGTIALYNMDNSDRTAEVGRVLLLDEYQGEGYMTEALKLLMDFAFTKLRLYRLRLTTFLDNAAAIALYSTVGFEALPRPVMLMEVVNPDKTCFKKPITLINLEEENNG